MKVIVDTNVWISFLLGKRLTMLRCLFNRDDIKIFVSEILLKEIREVSCRPKFKDKIKQESLDLLFMLIGSRCEIVASTNEADIHVRDKKDVFLLSIAKNINADYLIAGDQDLLILEKFEGTRILTFSDFMDQISPN